MFAANGLSEMNDSSVTQFVRNILCKNGRECVRIGFRTGYSHKLEFCAKQVCTKMVESALSGLIAVVTRSYTHRTATPS